MARSQDETRREFLLKLARAAAFVPPLVATVGVRPLAGQGGGNTTTGGSGGGGKGSKSTSTSTVGSLSPTAQVMSRPTFDLQSEDAAPWAPQVQGQAPPRSRPPPTQTGR